MSGKSRMARRTHAEGCASLVLREIKIETLPIDPIAIATSKGITVKAMPVNQRGVSGVLVKARDQFGILYATHINNEGFQRFSVGHELGHYCIDGHVDALLTNGSHYSNAGFHSTDPFEQEADHFAAALLMPDRPFKKEMERYDAGLGCVEQLAKACKTSLTATAIRYSAFTSAGIAIITSTGQTIDWCFMSDGMKGAKGISYLKKGTPVPSGTVTAGFNALPENVRAGKRESGSGRLNDWMGGEQVYRVEEEVVGLGQYGRTLTVLTCKPLSQDFDPHADDEEESDESMVERWTPKFHR